MPTQSKRPLTRGDCLDGPRPCPWAACRYHLASEQRGPEEVRESCALDVADRGGSTLEEVAACFDLTRERIRQIEAEALGKVRQIEAEERITGAAEAPARAPGSRGRPPVVTREALIEIARALAAERGQRGVTLYAVAARACVSMGAVYARFPSKRALLREAVGGDESSFP